jgi:chemotaxis protein MotB
LNIQDKNLKSQIFRHDINRSAPKTNKTGTTTVTPKTSFLKHRLMKIIFQFVAASLLLFATTSCVSKKKLVSLQSDLSLAQADLRKTEANFADCVRKSAIADREREKLASELAGTQSTLNARQDQINDLRTQLDDCKRQRDNTATQVGNLTVLSQSANDNIKETLSQLEKKDKYLHLLQAAKTKADSINLALAVNLKGVLSDGIADKDVEVKVDKTVVFVNLSDKMLYQTGSANITPKASDVLGKIAKIIESRPDLEIMVEGYTDNVPIKTTCFDDNWDLSVKRATAVVRMLQTTYKVDPNRLIAAGRGQYNTLASNDNEAGKATNRRTRIIILPKLDQFYDLLNPNLAPK